MRFRAQQAFLNSGKTLVLYFESELQSPSVSPRDPGLSLCGPGPHRGGQWGWKYTRGREGAQWVELTPLLLTLDEGYLLTVALPDLQRGIAPLGPPAPAQPPLLAHGVAPPGRRP